MAILKLSKEKLSFALGFLLYLIYPLSAIGISISGTLMYLVVLVISIIFYLYNTSINIKLLIFIYIFTLLYYLTYVFSIKTDYSNYKLVMLFAKVPVLILVPCLLRNYYKSFFWGILVAGILLILFSLGDVFALLSSVNINTRLNIGELNSIWITRVLFEVLLISLLILKNNLKYNLILLFIILPMVYVSGSKGPIVAILITLGFKYYQGKNLIKRRGILLLTGLLMITAFYYGQRYVASQPNTYLVQRFLSVVPQSASEEFHQGSRYVLWPETVNKYFNQELTTILFGVGVGNFSKLYYGSYNDQRFYPHNLILELLVEQGIIFLIIIGTFTIFLVRKDQYNFKYLFYYYFINAMFSGDIILNEFLFFYLSWAITTSSVNWPRFYKISETNYYYLVNRKNNKLHRVINDKIITINDE